jgi:hypothetical protein
MKVLIIIQTLVLLAINAIGQYATNRDVVIWQEDFQNGIPSGWLNTETSGMAAWEYRGPLTLPDLSVGSRGSCTNNFLGDPIQSSTQSNGFIIFDSNYWDNDSLPCTAENIGTGPVPGPHNAQLTTPSIDLSGVDYAVLQFEQYLRYYTGTTQVEMSIAQGPWVSVFNNDIPMGATSNNAMVIRIPLPIEASNNSDIRFRFNYNGLYYFWQIDDIAVIQVPANDLKIVSSSYGNFDINNTNNPTGYEYMEYSQYPPQMAPYLFFRSDVYNNGGEMQNNCRISATVIQSINGNIIFEEINPDGINMNPGELQNLTAPTYQMPTDTGNFKIVINTHQTENDMDVSNDSDTLGFRISPCVFARDKGNMTAVYNPNSIFWDLPFEISNVFMPTANMRVSAITVGLAHGTETMVNGLANQIRGKIYQFTYNDSILSELFATTPWFDLDTTTFNHLGENKFMELPFVDSIDLIPNTTYLVAIENNFGPNHLIVGTSGTAEEFTAWHQNNDEYFFVTKIPMIRLQSCFDTTIIYVEDTTTTDVVEWSHLALSSFPNPTHDMLELKGLPILVNLPYSIVDSQGRMVSSGVLKDKKEKINVNHLQPGCYLLQLNWHDQKRQLTFIKE